MKASCSTLHTVIGFISPSLSHGFMKAITLRVYESRFLFLLSKFSRVLVAKLLEQGYPPFRFLMNPPSTLKFSHSYLSQAISTQKQGLKKYMAKHPRVSVPPHK